MADKGDENVENYLDNRKKKGGKNKLFSDTAVSKPTLKMNKYVVPKAKGGSSS